MIHNLWKTYQPLIVVAFLSCGGSLLFPKKLLAFMGLFLSLLAVLKLLDLKSFAMQFRKYDILAKKATLYGYLYPFVELFLGVSFLAGFTSYWVGGLAFFVGFVGFASVLKAVYILKQSLHCACVGGKYSVPLGKISLLENMSMAAMGLYLFFV